MRNAGWGEGGRAQPGGFAKSDGEFVSQAVPAARSAELLFFGVPGGHLRPLRGRRPGAAVLNRAAWSRRRPGGSGFPGLPAGS